ncbi:MAG: AMP-binding protein [Cyanobacteria bacterium J06639_16]
MNGSPRLSHHNAFDSGASTTKCTDAGTSDVAIISDQVVDRSPLLLGRTLPSLLDAACGRTPNAQALNQWHHHQWRSLSNQALRRDAEDIALGLLAIGVQRGDRLPLVMHNSQDFCSVDMGCLLAGVVNVPIDLTQTIENILFILHHTQAKGMVVSNLDLLQQLAPYLWEATTLAQIIVAEVPEDWPIVRANLTRYAQKDSSAQPLENSATSAEPVLPTPERCLHIPQLLGDACSQEPCPPRLVPPCIQLMSLEEVRAQGRQHWTVRAVEQLRRAIAPEDLATIIYIASETQHPKGVMLTHENISANVLAAFTSYPQLQFGSAEVALLFLPLTHIFARVFLYGHLAYGHTIYLSDPNHLFKHLRTVRPTLMITVPRLLEKVHERLIERGRRLKGFDRAVFDWALKLAQRFDVEHPPQGLYAVQLQLAERLVFRKWRGGFGDRLKALISGGAALRADLVNLFTAAGLPVLQGYGLTETSGVVCYNRGANNRAGTVGLPIPGVAITLTEDREILIKAPFVTSGYYQNPDANQTLFDPDGWLRTGDLGEIDAHGFLSITGVKKALFKLATGKYVSPRPLEQAVMASPLVAYAIAVGANHKFCGMLIAPDLSHLNAIAQTAGLDTDAPYWWNHPTLLAHYQTLIDSANCHLPYWSTVRQFRILDPHQNARPTLDNGGRLPNGQLNRTWALTQFAADIEALYHPTSRPANRSTTPTPNNNALTHTCPIHAKSLLHH